MTEEQLWDRIWAAMLVGIGAGVATFAIVDLDREKSDIAEGRTHLTGTTFSSWTRRQVAKLGRHGPQLFEISMRRGSDAFLDWFIPHIADHIDAQKASF